jgi:urea transporter
VKEQFKNSVTALAGSYSQVFFSNNKWLAGFLILASFVDPAIGISGLLCVLFALAVAGVLGLNPDSIRNGWYTYNVLLTGMAMGANFQFNFTFVFVLIFASILSLLLSVWLASFTTRNKIPFLSLPFILSVWIIYLNARSFHTNLLSERNVYLNSNYLSALLNTVSQNIEHSGLPNLIIFYFKSIASIFFQDKLIAGVIISIGLVISSRITFFLSWLGFLSGYAFYRLAFGHSAETDYFNVGFNFIFSAIALAGFYLIPSISSYLLVIVSVPIIALFNTALLKIIAPLYLPLYSLPFTIVVIIIISVLNNRLSFKNLHFVQYQLFSPEKNLYAFQTYFDRFKKDTFVHIHLPFYGEWTVSQGHSGAITHKEDWQYAWDFVVSNDHKKTFKSSGKELSDFYCYALPVLTPADGQIITVEDGIEDNAIGDANMERNWGNTIIIKHTEFLYSKLCHLKPNSIKVKIGDFVKRGETLALCGNSGRSPEPHIHFQLQTTPYIGAPTLNYPISYYLTQKGNTPQLKAFDSPQEGEVIIRPIPTPLIKNAFHFIPGMKLNFDYEVAETITNKETWEVLTNAYNNSYLYCPQTKSTAYFVNNETLFYFTSFSGDKTSLLYYFYLAAYKVLLSYVPGLEIKDRLPVETSTGKVLRPLQDLIAPFYVFMKPYFTSVQSTLADANSQGKLYIHSKFCEKENGTDECPIEFQIELVENRINKITINKTKVCLVAKNIG